MKARGILKPLAASHASCRQSFPYGKLNGGMGKNQPPNQPPIGPPR